jgi:hypothetical protein
MNPTISTDNPVLIIGGGRYRAREEISHVLIAHLTGKCGLAIASGLEKVSGWEDGQEFCS